MVPIFYQLIISSFGFNDFIGLNIEYFDKIVDIIELYCKPSSVSIDKKMKVKHKTIPKLLHKHINLNVYALPE